MWTLGLIHAYANNSNFPALLNGRPLKAQHHAMDERGGNGATMRRAAAPSPPRHSPSSAATFTRNPFRASPSRDAPQRNNGRWCMAF